MISWVHSLVAFIGALFVLGASGLVIRQKGGVSTLSILAFLVGIGLILVAFLVHLHH